MMKRVTGPTAHLYLRLSDFRGGADGFDAREAKLRAKADQLGWTVGRVVIENDLTPTRNGRARPASAFKRRKIVTPSGRTELRVIRPGFRSVLDDLMAGRCGAVLAEDLDRACRDPPRPGRPDRRHRGVRRVGTLADWQPDADEGRH
jgi:site-specific DNA recombinase